MYTDTARIGLLSDDVELIKAASTLAELSAFQFGVKDNGPGTNIYQEVEKANEDFQRLARRSIKEHAVSSTFLPLLLAVTAIVLVGSLCIMVASQMRQ